MSDRLRLDVLSQSSFRDYFRRVRDGLKKSKDSGEYAYARFQLLRVILPFCATLVFCACLLLAASFLAMSGDEGHPPPAPIGIVKQDEIPTDRKPDEVKPDKADPERFMDASVEGPPTGVETPIGSIGPDFGPTAVNGDSEASPVRTVPTMMKNPLIRTDLHTIRTEAGRKQAQSNFNRTGHTDGEVAVIHALNWLKARQDADGSWRTSDKVDPTAMAGLAVLCFLARNETPSSAEYGETVRKAMQYIVSKQDQNGSFGREYTHGICTYALCEGFALTKNMSLKDAADKGINVILDGQQAQGGYDYRYAKGDRWDLSVAGWQFQAMKAAKMAGISNDRLDSAIRLGAEYLRQQAFSPSRGGFGYSGKPGVPGTGASLSMTGAGTLCLQLFGAPTVPEVRAGLQYMKEAPCIWTVGSSPNAVSSDTATRKEIAKNPVYTWYYVTQAKFQAGGKEWDKWNRTFSSALVSGQEKDGHWDLGDHGGAVYTTTLCCLMLEVYYRYLPTYQQHPDEVAQVKATAPDDVVVDVQ